MPSKEGDRYMEYIWRNAISTQINRNFNCQNLNLAEYDESIEELENVSRVVCRQESLLLSLGSKSFNDSKMTISEFWLSVMPGLQYHPKKNWSRKELEYFGWECLGNKHFWRKAAVAVEPEHECGNEKEPRKVESMLHNIQRKIYKLAKGWPRWPLTCLEGKRWTVAKSYMLALKYSNGRISLHDVHRSLKRWNEKFTR